MSSDELFQTFVDRVSEARIYKDQGLDEDAIGDLLGRILADIEECGLSDIQKEKLRLMVKSEPMGLTGGACRSQEQQRVLGEPSQHFKYGIALMDGQFWEEAINEFGAAADSGYEKLKSLEYCGDCASNMDNWGEAIRFYNMVYSDQKIPEEYRKQVLLKINKCSQTQKKAANESVINARNGGTAGAEQESPGPEIVTSSISALDGYSVDLIIGKIVESWVPPEDDRPGRASHQYRVQNLLHVGSSSLIVELEQQGSGKKLAGQILTGLFGEHLSAQTLAGWVREQAVNSSSLTRIYDLAHSEGHFFLVREYFPLSLCDILAKGELMPIPLAIRIAHQVLEALGDLHLHMGLDGKPGHNFHLDLRPSRVFLGTDKACAKVTNGGLWKILELAAPEQTSAAKLPLHYLPYRAPEQFRPYLARKRPPFFTDIYLFGALFYEMLTGVPAFKASSYEEYEIQHCEQYPSPPRVWRAEIPSVINDMIMQCLESNPTKRYRSTTQMSLLIEKAFSDAISRPKDNAYQEFLAKLNLI